MREDPPTPPCPACGSRDTRRSWPRNPWERVKGWLGIDAHRCEECELRFFARRLPLPHGDEPARYRLPPVWLLVILALPLFLAGGWWLWGRDASGPAPRPGDSPATTVVKRAMPSPPPSLTRQAAASTTTTTTSTTTAAPPPRRAAAPARIRRVKKKRTSHPRSRTRAPRGLWTVQVGAFRGHKRARDLARRLERKGLPVRVVRVAAPGRPLWYKVWIGAYPSRTRAGRAARRLRKKLRMPTLVARRDQPGAPGGKGHPRTEKGD